ncbi:hypothetical protein MMC15_008614 [Xylographa vitiligo]|nr:hypothetical protein [Xylographa vitiligo]
MAVVVPFVETCIYIGQAVGTLIVGLVGGIDHSDHSDHSAEIQFTQNIYTSNLANAQQAHVECPITWPRTQGYTCLSFDSGSFQLQGDGGFENWCYNGNYTNNGGGSVTFNTIDLVVTPPSHPCGAAPAPQTPPRAPTTPPTASTSSTRSRTANWTSGMAYYKQMLSNGGNNGQQPDVYINIKTDGAVTWESGVQKGMFPDGDQFSTWLGAAADIANVEDLSSGGPGGE